MTDVTFERLAPEHGAAVMAIFNYYVEHSFAAFPESPLPEAAFGMFLEMTKTYPGYVMKDGASGKVVGFCFLRAYHPLPVFKHTAEVTYFLAPEATGRGLGAVALELLEREARAQGITRLLAAIAGENAHSLAFHRKHGFSECGRFHGIGKKQGREFDVVWMEKALAE